MIKQLAVQGFTDVILAVGHLAELIRAYFNDGKRFGTNIQYSREKQPLGTIGPLSLIKEQLNDSFIVMNGDTLTDIDYCELLDAHRKNGSIATIALFKRSTYIDFGVVDLAENSIIDYHEKPTLHQYVSMGIYVFEPQILDYIQDSTRLDLPELVKFLIHKRKNVNGYIHNGYWLDIGRAEDYEKACNDINELLRKSIWIGEGKEF